MGRCGGCKGGEIFNNVSSIVRLDHLWDFVPSINRLRLWREPPRFKSVLHRIKPLLQRTCVCVHEYMAFNTLDRSVVFECEAALPSTARDNALPSQRPQSRGHDRSSDIIDENRYPSSVGEFVDQIEKSAFRLEVVRQPFAIGRNGSR